MRPSRRRLPGFLLLALLACPAAAQPEDPAAAAVEAYYGGDLESAAHGYREILKRNPWDLASRRDLVRLLRESGRPREALGHLELLILLRPQEPALGLQAAEVALLAGRAEQALGYLPAPEAGTAVAAEAQTAVAAEAGYLAGLALLELGRQTEAAAALEGSVQQQRFQPLAWFWLGRIRYKLGELELAEEALSTALAQEPNLTGCLPLLARIHLAQGRVQQAYALARRALAGQPGDRPLQELLREMEADQPSLAQEAGRKLELRLF